MNPSNSLPENLLACPFCDGSNLCVETKVIMPDNFHSAQICCEDCEIEGPHARAVEGWLSSREEAISMAAVIWNRRGSVIASEVDSMILSDLEKCPNCGGYADNGHDREIPPSAYYCKNCMISLDDPVGHDLHVITDKPATVEKNPLFVELSAIISYAVKFNDGIVEASTLTNLVMRHANK